MNKSTPYQLLAQRIEQGRESFLHTTDIASALNPPLVRPTKSVYVIGAVAPASAGTALYDIGNGDTRLCSLRDGDPLDSIITLMKPPGENDFLNSIWDSQCRKFDALQTAMNSKYRPMTHNNRFLQSSFTRNHNDGVIFDINFPKIRPRAKDEGIVPWRNMKKVVSGAVYHPRLLDHGSHPFFGYEKDVLVQPEIRDHSGSLVPPWLLQNELRPETLVLADIYLTVSDSACITSDGVTKPSRTFQIWVKSIEVLERGCHPLEQNPLPSPMYRHITPTPKEVTLRVKKRVARMSTGGKPPKPKKIEIVMPAPGPVTRSMAAMRKS